MEAVWESLNLQSARSRLSVVAHTMNAQKAIPSAELVFTTGFARQIDATRQLPLVKLQNLWLHGATLL